MVSWKAPEVPKTGGGYLRGGVLFPAGSQIASFCLWQTIVTATDFV